MNTRPSWEMFFMSQCYLWAYRSPDNSTKVGSVITTKDNVLLCSGYNGLPRGMECDTSMQKRPAKYMYFEHAERNAIYNGARAGVRMDLAHTIYVTWMPCAACARAIIQTGIERVLVHRAGHEIAKQQSKWVPEHNAAFDILSDRVVWYDGPIIGSLKGFFGGESYEL